MVAGWALEEEADTWAVEVNWVEVEVDIWVVVDLLVVGREWLA